MNSTFVFPRPQPAQPRATVAPEANRASDALRASVLDAALQLGLGSNGTVADWMFNNHIQEDDEENLHSPGLTTGSTTTSEDSYAPHQSDQSSAGASESLVNHKTHTGSYASANPSDESWHLAFSDHGSLRRDSNATPVPLAFSVNDSTSQHKSSSHKLRKRRFSRDGYGSDAAHVSDFPERNKTTKTKGQGLDLTADQKRQKKAKDKVDKERAKDEKERKKKEIKDKDRESKKVSKKKGVDTDDTDAGYLSEAIPTTKFKRPTKLKSKDKPAPEAGYETDDGNLSSLSKKKSRFFRLTTRSKAEPPVPPLPTLSQSSLPPKLAPLPIAERFATMSILPTVASDLSSAHGSTGIKVDGTKQAAQFEIASVDSGVSSSMGHGSGFSSEGHYQNVLSRYTSSTVGHGMSVSSIGHASVNVRESSGHASSNGHVKPSSSHGHENPPSLNVYPSITTSGPGENETTPKVNSKSNRPSTAPTPTSAFGSRRPSNASFTQATGRPKISLPITRSLSPAPLALRPRLNVSPTYLSHSNPTSRSPSPLFLSSSLSPASPYIILANPRNASPSQLSDYSVIPSSDYVVPSPLPSPTRSHFMHNDIPPPSPPPVGPLPRTPATFPSTAPPPTSRLPPLYLSSLQPPSPLVPKHPHSPQRGRESPFPSRPITRPGLESRVPIKRHQEVYTAPTIVSKQAASDSHFERIVGDYISMDAEDEEAEDEADRAIQDVLDRFVDTFGDGDRELGGAALERKSSMGVRAYMPSALEGGRGDDGDGNGDDDDKSCYPDEDKSAGRSTMYRVENDGEDEDEDEDGHDRRYSISRYSPSLSSHRSILDGEASGLARERFVERVEAMFDDDGREQEMKWGKGRGSVPPVPKMPYGLIGGVNGRSVPVRF